MGKNHFSVRVEQIPKLPVQKSRFPFLESHRLIHFRSFCQIIPDQNRKIRVEFPSQTCYSGPKM